MRKSSGVPIVSNITFNASQFDNFSLMWWYQCSPCLLLRKYRTELPINQTILPTRIISLIQNGIKINFQPIWYCLKPGNSFQELRRQDTYSACCHVSYTAPEYFAKEFLLCQSYWLSNLWSAPYSEILNPTYMKVIQYLWRSVSILNNQFQMVLFEYSKTLIGASCWFLDGFTTWPVSTN